MNNNPLGNFADEVGETATDAASDLVREAKKQIMDKRDDLPAGKAGAKDQEIDDGKKKVDPVTNKPIPTKKVLTQLSIATIQLQQVKLKKIREELDKQRLKTAEPASAKASAGQGGPELPAEKPKPKDDAVATTLRNAKSTGELGKNIGG